MWLGVAALVVIGGYAGVVRPIKLGEKQIQNLIQMRVYTSALDEFKKRHGKYPTSLDDAILESDLTHKDVFLPKVDRWGHLVDYQSDGQQYLLVSFGRDGRPDGSDYAGLRRAGQLENGPCRNPDADTIFSDRGELRNCGK